MTKTEYRIWLVSDRPGHFCGGIVGSPNGGSCYDATDAAGKAFRGSLNDEQARGPYVSRGFPTRSEAEACLGEIGRLTTFESGTVAFVASAYDAKQDQNRCRHRNLHRHRVGRAAGRGGSQRGGAGDDLNHDPRWRELDA